MSAVKGIPLDEARRDRQYWGRLTETAVGAHLLAQAQPLTTDAAVVLAQSLQAQSVARERATLPAIVAE